MYTVGCIGSRTHPFLILPKEAWMIDPVLINLIRIQFEFKYSKIKKSPKLLEDNTFPSQNCLFLILICPILYLYFNIHNYTNIILLF